MGGVASAENLTPMGRCARGLRRALVLVLALSAGGCASTSEGWGYYWQSATGHARLMAGARPVSDWLADATTPSRLKERLALAARIRAFASRELGLPDNRSYTRYADLGRPAALWNLVAAGPLSLELQTWCFPVAGCVGYQGWFDEDEARIRAQALQAQGWDTAVYPVPAYSTLGWLNWVGGDPLLNTFVHYGDGELAALIFHELAHQVLYVKDDTAFNESFATAVERLGVAQWLAQEGSEVARREFERSERRREEFRALKRGTRAALSAVYAPAPGGADDAARRMARKAEILAQFRGDYQRLRAGWGGEGARFRWIDRWVQEANNASFAAEAAYDDGVPGFQALHAQVGGDWRRFYDEVKRLAERPRPERHQRLKELARARPTPHP